MHLRTCCGSTLCEKSACVCARVCLCVCVCVCVVQALEDALTASHCQLRFLSLKEVNLSRIGLQHLCTGLASNRSVLELDLSGNKLNQLGPKVPLDLRAMLEKNRSLSKLNLSYTGIRTHNTHTHAHRHTQTRTHTHVHLRTCVASRLSTLVSPLNTEERTCLRACVCVCVCHHTGVGSEAAADILLGAVSSVSLTHLDLSQCHISDQLPASLLRASPSVRPPPLTHLNLGFNWVQVR